MFSTQNQANLSKYQQIKKYFLMAMMVLLSVSAILGISLVLFGASLMQLRVIGTTVTLGISALLMAGNVSRLDAQTLPRILAWISLVANLIATVLIILLIWGLIDPHCERGYDYEACYRTWFVIAQVLGKVFSICLNIALTLAIIGRFLTYTPRRQSTLIVCRATIICTVIVGIVFALMTLFDIWLDDVTSKLLIILCIVLVFGLIATPILIKIEQNHEKQIADNDHPIVDEQALRAQIEQEVRAKIAAEQSQISQTQDQNQSQIQSDQKEA